MLAHLAIDGGGPARLVGAGKTGDQPAQLRQGVTFLAGVDPLAPLDLLCLGGLGADLLLQRGPAGQEIHPRPGGVSPRAGDSAGWVGWAVNATRRTWQPFPRARGSACFGRERLAVNRSNVTSALPPLPAGPEAGGTP